MAVRQTLFWSVATSLMNLGNVATEQGDHAARLLQEESLAIFRDLENREGIANALLNLENTVHHLDDHATASALQEEDLAIFRELGDLQGIAISLLNQGNTVAQQGDHARANAAYLESLALFHDMGDRYSIAACLTVLASLTHSRGSGARAARLWGAASAMEESIGSLSLVDYQEQRDHDIPAAREALSEAAFSAAWDASRAMTLEQATDSALSQE